jgi:hypothetical protein
MLHVATAFSSSAGGKVTGSPFSPLIHIRLLGHSVTLTYGNDGRMLKPTLLSVVSCDLALCGRVPATLHHSITLCVLPPSFSVSFVKVAVPQITNQIDQVTE